MRPLSLNNRDLLAHSTRRMEAIVAADAHAYMPDQALIKSFQEDPGCSLQIFAKVCAAYAERPALGGRAYRVVTRAGVQVQEYLPAFTTISFSELWQRTVALATGFKRHAKTRVETGEIIGIYGFASPDYVSIDMACLYLGATSAVLQTSMRSQDLQHITNEGPFAAMVCSLEQLEAVVPVLPRCPSVRSLVVMDVCPQDTAQAAKLEQIRTELADHAARGGRQVELLTIHELESFGREAEPLAPFIPAAGSDPLATLMYTSGSTGSPKGAMLTERVWKTYWQAKFLNGLISFPQITTCFYPLNHVMGRNGVIRSLVQGGLVTFTLKSDMSTLFEDIRLTRPTMLELVPRVSDLIYQDYRNELLRRSQGGPISDTLKEEVMSTMRHTFLGDRLMGSFSGSAPTSPEVKDFLKTCFEIPVFEAYGSTEGGVYTVDEKIARSAVIDYRLIDVPELGYRLTDKPYPRGELLVKTRRGVPGYYKNPDASHGLYTDDGYMITGDVVEERGPDLVTWIDRKSNVLKLSQGEFVAIWRLETTFDGGSPFLSQVYLYGTSSRAYLLAVIVPAHAAVRERLASEGKPVTAANVKQLLRAELNRVAAAEELRSYEVPRDFIVENEPFTQENGMLTGVNKPARPQLKQKYGPALEAMYGQLELQQRKEIAALNQPGQTASVATKLQKALEAILGLPEVQLNANVRFKDLGGDSLHAVSLATLLQDICKVAVPVSAILNPGSTLLDLVQFIKNAESGAPSGRPSFASVHGEDVKVIKASDLRLNKFLTEAELEAAEQAKAQALPAESKVILLTGATGFLGRFLCLEWLEHAAKVSGKVYSIVRAPNAAAAFSRLREVFASGDDNLLKRFDELSTKHLVVLAGDLAKEKLGLSSEIYEQLASTVDLISHPGALVNHVFSYEQLFEPNVVGTAELIRLALYKRRKRLDYVSTVGVLSGAKNPGKVLEAQGVDALKADWQVSGDYASGYSTSKWASEVLLKELNTRFGIPVHVFRCDMILPHRQYRGQINVPDMFTRLLASLVYTGLAPRSFYAEGASAPATPHYDGLPVDFVAASMVGLALATPNDYATYQMSNCHWDDGVSLDKIVSWVESAGYKVDRIGPHQKWFEQFKSKLLALSPTEQQHSSLPILAQWQRPSYNWEQDLVDASRFQAKVQALKLGGESDIPHLSEGYIHKYLADMQALGVIL